VNGKFAIAVTNLDVKQQAPSVRQGRHLTRARARRRRRSSARVIAARSLPLRRG
jgi:hypothetical protein